MKHRFPKQYNIRIYLLLVIVNFLQVLSALREFDLGYVQENWNNKFLVNVHIGKKIYDRFIHLI